MLAGVLAGNSINSLRVAWAAGRFFKSSIWIEASFM